MALAPTLGRGGSDRRPDPADQGPGILGRDIDLRGMLAQRSKILLVFWSMYCKSCVEKFRRCHDPGARPAG
jgi:hypothetical protein